MARTKNASPTLNGTCGTAPASEVLEQNMKKQKQEFESMLQAMRSEQENMMSQVQSMMAAQSEQIASLKREKFSFQEKMMSALAEVKALKEKKSPSLTTLADRVEWRIENISQKMGELHKGAWLESPTFSAAGMSDLKLDFYPNGSSECTKQGFCSLFVWCPANTLARYKLSVGDRTVEFEHRFDKDEPRGRPNFCLLESQMDNVDDSVTVALEFISVRHDEHLPNGMKLTSRLVDYNRQIESLAHKPVKRVEWQIDGLQQKMKEFPKGVCLESPSFSAAGISDMVLAFYPNGSSFCGKGSCSLHLRCPPRMQVRHRLFVGKKQDQPNSDDMWAFWGGLDFNQLQGQVEAGADVVTVGVEFLGDPATAADTASLQL